MIPFILPNRMEKKLLPVVDQDRGSLVRIDSTADPDQVFGNILEHLEPIKRQI